MAVSDPWDGVGAVVGAVGAVVGAVGAAVGAGDGFGVQSAPPKTKISVVVSPSSTRTAWAT